MGKHTVHLPPLGNIIAELSLCSARCSVSEAPGMIVAQPHSFRETIRPNQYIDLNCDSDVDESAASDL